MYQLQSFEIDPYQSLHLAVLILDGEDSLLMQGPWDSVSFRPLVPVATDTTALLTNSDYVEVPLAINYPLLWIVLGVILFAGVMTLVLFGRKIMTAIHIRRLRKDYLRYNQRLTEAIRLLRESPEVPTAEHALTDWKKFMERMEGLPYSKLTTAEILSDTSHDELAEPLRSIDRMVYGEMGSDTIYRSFQSLEDFTQHRYQLKLNELKNGPDRQ